MTVHQDLSFISLISNASLLVQLVMLLLVLLSVVSWAYIFRKMLTVRQAKSETSTFEQAFWSGANLAALHKETAANRHSVGSIERIFLAGMDEFRKVRSVLETKNVSDPDAILDGARRAMRAAYQREMDMLESNLAFLASTGSVAPYIGLFGTVWGIMNAFRGLANVEQASLAAVAPGIAEALIATAIGLFAAIPAVVAYNRYSHEIDRLSMRFETFIEEFSNILQRQVH